MASERTPKQLADAVLALASAIYPSNFDSSERERVRKALTTLVDEVLAQADRRAALAAERGRDDE